MANTELAEYLFHQGTNLYSYEYLGCNRISPDGYEYSFRVWAPNAKRVELVGDFSGWEEGIPLKRITERGIWELVYSANGDLNGAAYKFRIVSDGGVHLKGDPYARYSRGGADGASVVYCKKDFAWGDKGWLSHRAKTVKADEKSYIRAPLNIYELHAGSFMRHPNGEYYSYRELSEVLPSYLKKLGYTHVEFLPLQEHPFDGSWGYQVCAFYAPTSRYGTPDDLKYLIDKLHRAGIGVIMDWVPAHFPKDEWGLYEFDGSALYEYQGRDRQESRSWGTRFFDLGREEIQSFLISNALYFLREFHIDGLRVDAVASMIYLDYDREPGEWNPNPDGSNTNREGVAFFRKLNSAVFAEFPDALMIAEESSAFGGITAPVESGGLGFNLKWNMGWANDFYDYISTDPLYRKEKHKALTFPLMYAFTENFCLPISHDEVVHGKKSLINKCFGSYEDKFRCARVAIMLQMTYPGKKLLFMGTEYAQFREWDYENELEWFMTDYPAHESFRQYVAALNRFYLSREELWSFDFSPRGFEWISPDDACANTVAFLRKGECCELIVILSFSGCEQAVTVPLPKGTRPEVIFDTGNLNENAKTPIIYKDGEASYATYRLPGLSGVIVKATPVRKKTTRRKKDVL